MREKTASGIIEPLHNANDVEVMLKRKVVSIEGMRRCCRAANKCNKSAELRKPSKYPMFRRLINKGEKENQINMLTLPTVNGRLRAAKVSNEITHKTNCPCRIACRFE